jgi:2-haloacid dehalogenase
MTKERLDGIEACVFDAYGTLFDVNAAAAACSEELGDKWLPLAETWRLKQLQYTWLRSLMGRHADFWQVTGDGLDFAMASLGIDDAALRERLMDLYLRLDAYPEVPEVLRQLKAAGKKTAILSNGSPRMLEAAVRNAGIDDVLDGVLSVEDAGIYKPHPSVYELVTKSMDVAPQAVSFQSSNGWDAHAAKAFGFRVVWINRFGQARERIPDEPDIEITSLNPLPGIVGAT